MGSAAWTADIVRCTATTPCGVVRLLAGDTSLWVGLSDWEAFLRSAPFMPGVTLADLPPDIAVAVVEAAAEPIFQAVSRATGLAWTVIEFLPSGHPPHPWQVGFQLTGPDDARLNAQLSATPADLPFVESLIARVPLSKVPDAPAPPLVAAVEIGMTSLPVGELRTLRSRDVLVMDVTAFAPDRHGVIRISKTAAWRVTVGDGEVTLVEPRTTTPAAPLPLDSPSVNVVIEFGEVVIPAPALAGLAAGQQWPIEQAGRMRLSIEGRPFATGELVDLGAKLGVRLLEVGRPPR